MACPPAAVMAATVARHAPTVRSSAATAIPSRARRQAVAAPMPRAAPVTMATRRGLSGMTVSLTLLAGNDGVRVEGDDAPGVRQHGIDLDLAELRVLGGR